MQPLSFFHHEQNVLRPLPFLSQEVLLLGPRWMGKIKLSISHHHIVNFQFSLDDHLANLYETDYYERRDKSSFPLPTIILLSNLTHSNFLSRFKFQKLRQPRNWEEWNVEILKILSITSFGCSHMGITKVEIYSMQT